MADYKESTISGTSWQRTNQIVIVNPSGGTPTVIYNEETAFNIGTMTITSPCGNLTVPCSDMTEEIPLLNPVDGSSTGQTMTMGQLYQAIYSHYIAKATERDNANAP
jgi:hypothetical protein